MNYEAGGVVSVIKQKYGNYNGKEVYLYTLDNNNGLSAEIINYGGIIRKLIFNRTDVVLGRDNFEDYLDNDGCLGALIGRNANRVENAEFEINGRMYQLAKNDGGNNIHGGIEGFDKKVWDSEIIDADEPSLLLSLVSPDGEEGFPGTVKVRVKYTLKKHNVLKIEYFGETDKDTILNMTNHSYFNLNGHSSGIISNHMLKLNCRFYTPVLDTGVPTGEILSVKENPFDFIKVKALSSAIYSEDKQIKIVKGINHNFIVDGKGFRLAARLVGDKSDIVMEVYTDQPGMQIYTGNYLNNSQVYKDNAIYDTYHGICFETQAFPNFSKFSHFLGGFLKETEVYHTVTEYRFEKNS